MKLSIIIPVYNVEDYVLECLDSIRSLDIDYEIIVVNDGSKDNSLEKVRLFSNSFIGDIKIVDQENGGLSLARNVGIKNASGDYLFFLDSDDYIIKSYFETFVKEVFHDGVDIGFGGYRYLQDGKIKMSKEASYRNKIHVACSSFLNGQEYGELYFNRFRNFLNVEACFLIIKRAFLISNQLEFMRGIYHEDTLFTLSSLMVAKKVKYYNYPFYIYRVRKNSIMHTIDSKIIEKKYMDKEFIALQLFKLKSKYCVSTFFIDSIIVDLILNSTMHFKRKTSYVYDILRECRKLTIKSQIRVFLYKLLSLRYE